MKHIKNDDTNLYWSKEVWSSLAFVCVWMPAEILVHCFHSDQTEINVLNNDLNAFVFTIADGLACNEARLLVEESVKQITTESTHFYAF